MDEVWIACASLFPADQIKQRLPIGDVLMMTLGFLVIDGGKTVASTYLGRYLLHICFARVAELYLISHAWQNCIL